MSAKFTIKETDGRTVELTVTRTCGHVDALSYGGRKFAEADAPKMAASACISCINKGKIQLKTKTHDRP